jgi:hypothetical protein
MLVADGGISRGDHDHRNPHAGAAELPADLEPVDIGQHHVEHDGVVLRACTIH